MKNKLKFLILESLKRKIKTKWFLFANIGLFILIAGIINIDSVIKFFGGDFSEKQLVYVVDNSNKTFDLLKKQNEEYTFVLKKDVDSLNFDIKKAKKEPRQILEDKKKSWVLIINNNDENILDAKLISNGYINTTDYAEFVSILNNTKLQIALNETNIKKEDLAKIQTPIKIEREVLDKTKKSEDENQRMILTTIFPFIILPFFALTIFLVQMIGAEVNDEKATRGMEIIISNVSPKIHLLSKVVASNLFVIIQGLLLILFSLIGVLIRKMIGNSVLLSTPDFDINGAINSLISSDIGTQLIYIIPLTILLMFLTFLAYSLLAGVLASMTTNIEDFQQLQTPIMIISLVGYYLAVMAGVFEGSLFIKVAAFVPFISAILAPCLLMLGQFSIIEFIVSILLVIGVIYLLIKYGFRIYKQGILNYSSKGLWKKMFKAMKSK